MDPNATLRAIIHYANNGQAEEMLVMAEKLANWLQGGGFSPDVVVADD